MNEAIALGFKTLLNYRSSILSFNSWFSRTYAKKESGTVSMLGGALKKKKMGKLGPIVEKVVLPVETDTEKLTKYLCGGNIYKTGEEIPLKPDSEYPDWLWNLRLGPRPLLEELEPGSREYWKVARKIGIAKNQILLKIKRGKFFFRRPTRPVGLSSLVVQRPMYSRKIVK